MFSQQDRKFMTVANSAKRTLCSPKSW